MPCSLRIVLVMLAALAVGCGEEAPETSQAPKSITNVIVDVTSPGQRLGKLAASRSWTVCGQPTAERPAWPDPEACDRLRNAPTLLEPIGVETRDKGPIDVYQIRVRVDGRTLEFPTLGSSTRRDRWAQIKQALLVDAWEQAIRTLPPPRTERPFGSR